MFITLTRPGGHSVAVNIAAIAQITDRKNYPVNITLVSGKDFEVTEDFATVMSLVEGS